MLWPGETLSSVYSYTHRQKLVPVYLCYHTNIFCFVFNTFCCFRGKQDIALKISYNWQKHLFVSLVRLLLFYTCSRNCLVLISCNLIHAADSVLIDALCNVSNFMHYELPERHHVTHKGVQLTLRTFKIVVCQTFYEILVADDFVRACVWVSELCFLSLSLFRSPPFYIVWKLILYMQWSKYFLLML